MSDPSFRKSTVHIIKSLKKKKGSMFEVTEYIPCRVKIVNL